MNGDRRDRFRIFMKNMDPTSNPVQAVESGFYVTPPGAVGRRIAARLDIEPASSHLLIGGIGSGKTTELIQIENALGTVGDILTARVDVPAVHRVDKLKSGVLIALAAVAAVDRLRKNNKTGNPDSAQLDDATENALEHITSIVHGHWDHRWSDNNGDPNPEPDDVVWVKGVIEAPPSTNNIEKLSNSLRIVAQSIGRGLVVIFDGLDRVLDPLVFALLVREDIPAIRRAGVGIVLVGPQQVRFSEQRQVVDLFTEFHLHGASAFHTDAGKIFLESVLNARAGKGFFPEGTAEKLAFWSGGLLRDLISLARAAGEEAYVSGADSIEQVHIDVAADRYGRNLLLSANTKMAERLKDLVPRRSGIHTARPKERPSFVVSSDIDITMLLNRLIIEIPGTPVQYTPHPTIVPLIRGMSGGP